jgi:hypothetical protein
VAGPKIEDPRLFVGRKEELRAIRSRMTGVQPISLNIYGERRIGKSSLLYHFFQTNPDDPTRYVIVYVSMQNAACTTQPGFYSALADALASRPIVASNPALSAPLRIQPMTDVAFGDAVRQWKQLGALPVICLDEFEALMEHPKQFDNDFFNHLRALMDDNALMLVIASFERLDVYQKRRSLTSRFFNLGHVQELGRLKPDEAEALVKLPAGAQPALTDMEQRLALSWGQLHPYLLQLACGSLCEARQLGYDVNWAKAQFDAQAVRHREPEDEQKAARPGLRWWSPFRWLLVDAPMRVGRLAKWIGASLDDLGSWLIGMAIVVVVVLVVIRLLAWDDLEPLLRRVLGQTP